MKVEVLVYGAEELCASCVNLPSSAETASWLSAALGRKYGNRVSVRHVDIHHPTGEKEKASPAGWWKRISGIRWLSLTGRLSEKETPV